MAMNYDAVGNGNGLINTESQFVGFVTQIQPSSSMDVLGWIHVESHADKLVRRHIVTITSKTRLFLRKGDSYYPASFEVFQKKHWVKVWFAGPIKELYPKDTIGRQVIIINRP